MSTAIQNAHIEIGDTGTSPPQFEADCIPGDWQSYQLTFDTHFQDAAKVRVIVTANNKNIHPSNYNPAVVGVVTAVTTSGFTLWARNSDCKEGLAGFYFMAVEELSQPPPGEGVDLRYGILQQKFFKKDCEPGDSQKWFPSFSSPFGSGERVALVTGCNLNVLTSNVPAVGISQNLDVNGFELVGRNSAACMPSSGTTGACAFYWVAGEEGEKPKPDNRIWIDSGVVEPKTFGRACKTSSPRWTNSWEVYFSKPFQTPPVVLLTCRDAGVLAVVGLAQNVTTHGFTLAGLNSDCYLPGGRAQFNWVAIGCGEGCG